ncbi:hypothetical protein [Streptomyces acidiscabies]|uniref:Calcium-binding protein n=1 Tax=Streptomyces acidiscabies TaxID=42234 RepID=A0AAP6BD59_9ACTN|nr:hypothetical protein [Streptomyces acidiscabies]MBP5938842.1 hypothetical protein [Streptomyces sp. LBUM 1476]MBZ3909960.1 hypothetical protein [Streptomyces acidiscabies]MDX2962566.1 hypothetical protein [Streptomyces acidiscabies]MDX3020479.1 hypothetical protein [Streptomyces acidiscabies]MDX3789947.1 hypothetical protein [Streptomyces acidiscabies]
MRIRATATAAVVLGTVALSALAVPTAQAAPAAGSKVTFSNVKIAKNLVIGASGRASFAVTYTVTKPASLSAKSLQTGPAIYRGTLAKPSDLFVSENPGTCKAPSATVLNCTAALVFNVTDGDLSNSETGAWKVGGVAIDAKKVLAWQENLGSTKLLRKAKLTTDATPEPVKKGKTITVKGSLTRANWETNKYAGYGAQTVQLQYKKAGATTWTTVKSVKTTAKGALSTTVKATADGYYRYNFVATSTTGAVASAADYVDVR